jgi:hypothetical protein
LNKTLDIFAVNIATNDELYTISTADCTPLHLHAKLVADLGASGFELILRPADPLHQKASIAWSCSKYHCVCVLPLRPMSLRRCACC